MLGMRLSATIIPFWPDEPEQAGVGLIPGNFRVLFLLAGDALQVYAVKDRKEAYE